MILKAAFWVLTTDFCLVQAAAKKAAAEEASADRDRRAAAARKAGQKTEQQLKQMVWSQSRAGSGKKEAIGQQQT